MNTYKILATLGVLVALGAFWQHFHSPTRNPKTPPPPTTTAAIQIGLNHPDNFAQKVSAEEENFVLPNYLRLHTYALEGFWVFNEDSTTLKQTPGKIKLHFYGKKVILRAESKNPATIKIATDSTPPTFLEVSTLQDYTLFESSNVGEHTMEITITSPSFSATNLSFQ